MDPTTETIAAWLFIKHLFKIKNFLILEVGTILELKKTLELKHILRSLQQNFMVITKSRLLLGEDATGFKMSVFRQIFEKHFPVRGPIQIFVASIAS